MGLSNGYTNGINGVNGVNGINDTAKVVRPLRPGVWSPIPTFFKPGSEELDIPTFRRHVLSLAKVGMGVLICGSMGEGHNLEDSERLQLFKAARQVLDDNGLTQVPIIAGTGCSTTRQTIALTKAAADVGADYAIVITSGYFAGALDASALKAYFIDVAEASPIPVIIYNYPGAAGGLDLDSDLVVEIAKASSNICGVKLTCGNVGKLVRIATQTSIPAFNKLYPRKNKDAPFLTLGGFADFILPGAFGRGSGAIVGLGNVAPRSLVRVTELSFQALIDPSVLPEAQRLQDIVAAGDRTIALAGIAGTKFLLEKLHGYGGAPRRPMQRLLREKEEALWAHENVQALIELERQLERDALVKSSTTTARSTAPESTSSTTSHREVSVSA